MAVDIFLKLAGITGEAHDAQHKGEIDILGWSWGVEDTVVGEGGGAAEIPKFQQLSVQKRTDLATAPLLAAAAKGTHIASGTLTVRKAGAAPEPFLVVNLKDVLVTSVDIEQTQSQDRPGESVTLRLGQIDFEYTEFKADGSKGAADSFKWDIVTNREL